MFSVVSFGAHFEFVVVFGELERGFHLQRSLTMALRAVAQEPNNPAYRDSLGWAYFQLGEYAAALKELELAVRDQPDGEILEHLGDTLEKLGRRKDARAAWEKAAASFTEDKDDASLQALQRKMAVAEANP